MDRNGDWVKSWGERGRNPGQFNTPHSIAADAHGNIYVADRGNRRIQVFDGDGKFLREIHIDVPYDAAARPAIGHVDIALRVCSNAVRRVELAGARTRFTE